LVGLFYFKGGDMRRKLMILVAVLIGLSGLLTSAFALEIGSQEVEITLTDSYVSGYIWRGQDLYADNDGAHQSSIDIAFPKLIYDTDVSLNVWGSFPINSGHVDAEELDYTLTFSRDLLDDAINVSVGYTYFDYPKTESTADVSEPWISATLNKLPFLPIEVSFTGFIGYDFQAKSGGPDEGIYFSWGFDTELPLPQLALFQEGQTLALGIVNWGNDGPADLEPSSLYATEISLSTSYGVAGFSISPNLHYTINYEESINDGNEELWGGIEVSYAF